jgi:hypothetical protein
MLDVDVKRAEWLKEINGSLTVQNRISAVGFRQDMCE